MKTWILGLTLLLAPVTEALASGKIPVYPGSKALVTPPSEPSYRLYLAPAPASRVIGYLKGRLAKEGWVPVVPDDFQGPEGQALPQDVLLYERGSDVCQVVIAPRTGASSTVLVQMSQNRGRHGKPSR